MPLIKAKDVAVILGIRPGMVGDLGFELTACELDKEYYGKAIERITKHTAQQFLFEP